MLAFGHLSGLMGEEGLKLAAAEGDEKKDAPKDDKKEDAKAEKGEEKAPEATPPMAPPMLPMGPKFGPGQTVRDIFSGATGVVEDQQPAGDLGDILFVNFDGQVQPIRTDQLQAIDTPALGGPAPLGGEGVPAPGSPIPGAPTEEVSEKPQALPEVAPKLPGTKAGLSRKPNLTADSEWGKFGDAVDALVKEKTGGKFSLETPWQEGQTSVHQLFQMFEAGKSAEEVADKLVAEFNSGVEAAKSKPAEKASAPTREFITAKEDPRHLTYEALLTKMKASKTPTHAEALAFIGYLPEKWDLLVARLAKDGVALVSPKRQYDVMSLLKKGHDAAEVRTILASNGVPVHAVDAVLKLIAEKPTVPPPSEDPGSGKVWAWDAEKKGWYAADAVNAAKVAAGGTTGGAGDAIDWKETPQALTIKVNEVLQNELKEVVAMGGFESNDAFNDLTDALQQDGIELIAPEEVGALTSAPIFGRVERDDRGKLLSANPVWWYPQYETKDPIEELAKNGQVVFEGAPENLRAALVTDREDTASIEPGARFLEGDVEDGFEFEVIDGGNAAEMAEKYPSAWEEAKKNMSSDQWPRFLEMDEPVYAVHFDGFDEGDLSLVTRTYLGDCERVQ